MSKTFGQAFSEARKQGLDKFQWNGNWYSTKTKEESSAKGTAVTLQARNKDEKYIKGQSQVVNGRAQHSVQQGNRYKITKVNGNQFGIYDTESYGYIGRAFNSLQDAQNFLNSDEFTNMGEVVVAAPRTTVDRKSSGYVPVDGRTDLVDQQGNTRVFQNYETGEYFVTDKFGNIIGQSYDPAAANPGFMGWNVYTGSRDDMVRSELGEKKAEYDRNEVNQLARQKEDRQRAGEEGLIKDIQDARHNFAAGTYNFAANATNLPNHLVLGGIRAATSDQYSAEDWVRGLNPANFTGNTGQTVGLGDVFEMENPYLRTAANFANLYSIPRNITLPQTSIQAGQPQMLNIRVASQPGSVYRYTKTTFPAKGWGNQASAAQTYVQAPMPTAPTMVRTPGSFTPGSLYNAGFLDLRGEQPQQEQEVPTAVFKYDNGPVNQTVMGRILTGDFVPGTTSPHWDGTIHGGSSGMYNTNGHHFSGFGGVTAGPAQDNTTDKYASDSTPSKPKLKSKKKKDDGK